MPAIKELEQHNKIDQKEFEDISKLIFQSFLIKPDYKSSSVIFKKEELLEHFSIFLEKYMELHFLNSSQDKLKLMNFLDKLNMQRELLDIEKGKIELSEIQIAAQKFGRKAQSAFKLKQ